MAFGLVGTVVGGVWLLPARLESAAVLLNLAGRPTNTGWAGVVLPDRRVAVTTRDVAVPTRDGAIDARLYEPQHRSGHTLIVFPGVHAGGLDEPRLVRFARRLAETGTRVLSVPLPDLRRFRLTPRSTDMIEDATGWLAGQRDLAPEGRVDLAGISFAGGLAMVAAGRPSLRDKLDRVVSFGGQADLPRVMRYLCTGELPGGGHRAPHDYGLAVVLLHSLTHLVPIEQQAELDRAVVGFLSASSIYESRPEEGERLLNEVRAAQSRMAEPARGLLAAVLARDVAALGPRLLPFVEDVAGNPALSPARSMASGLPTFLLHGEADNVIPPSETPALAAYLESHGNRDVRFLLTPLVSHATMTGGASPVDALRLINFWTAMTRH